MIYLFILIYKKTTPLFEGEDTFLYIKENKFYYECIWKIFQIFEIGIQKK